MNEPMMETAINLENMGEFIEAIKIFDQILRNNPSNAVAYFFIGKALIAIGQFEEALDALEKAKNLGFRGMQTLMYPMIALSKSKKFDGPDLSESHLEKIEVRAEVYLPDANDWIQTAVSYQMLGKYEEAYKSYKIALKTEPDSKIALDNIKLIESLSVK